MSSRFSENLATSPVDPGWADRWGRLAAGLGRKTPFRGPSLSEGSLPDPVPTVAALHDHKTVSAPFKLGTAVQVPQVVSVAPLALGGNVLPPTGIGMVRFHALTLPNPSTDVKGFLGIPQEFSLSTASHRRRFTYPCQRAATSISLSRIKSSVIASR